jgi:hypothetical protein
MTSQRLMIHALATVVIVFAAAPVVAQTTAPVVKTDMPPISGNVQMPAGQQNQSGGPMGDTGTTLQSGTLAARPAAPARAAAPSAAPVAAPAPAPAPKAALPMRRARTDRG